MIVSIACVSVFRSIYWTFYGLSIGLQIQQYDLLNCEKNKDLETENLSISTPVQEIMKT